MKIDTHVHITPPDIINNWEKYAESEPYFSLISHSKVNKFAKAEEVIASMESDNITRSVVFGFAFRDMGLCRFVNDYVIESINKFPDKLTGFAVVSPCNKESVKEIERCYKAGLKGIGELFPEGQGFSLDIKKETDAVTSICKELDIPVMLHANEPVGHLYPGKTNVTLKQLETFIVNNPELKIILAHFGGGLFFYETMNEVKESFINVFYDTAISPFLYNSKIYNVIKTLALCDKILFGSDFPILKPSRYFSDIENSGLSEDEKQLIYAENAKRLLGL